MTIIKQLRTERGISQQTLAEAIGCAQPNIYQYENGIYEPDIETLCKLADFFHVSIDELVGHAATDIQISEDVRHHLHLYDQLTPEMKDHLNALMEYSVR